MATKSAGGQPNAKVAKGKQPKLAKELKWCPVLLLVDTYAGLDSRSCCIFSDS
jgi:hypothetical protein